MATAKEAHAKALAADVRRKVALIEEAGGVLHAVWPEVITRFMFDDGSIVDVLTSRDDSDLRGVLLDTLHKHAIVGSTRLPQTSTVPGDVS